MRPAEEARAALGLLTILPLGARAVDAEARRGAALWFPLVGALVGVAAAVTWAVAESLLGGAYATALALTVSAVLAGALHHDGLADTADGLGVRGDRERRLAAMRDPGIGAYGALALIAYALLALTALSGLSASQAASALICGHTLGRWSTLPQLAWIEPAREDGLGASFQATPATLAIGSACAVVIAIVSCGLVAGAAAIAAAALATAAVALVAWRFVGGRSGDTLGASALLVEVIVYSVLAAYWLA